MKNLFLTAAVFLLSIVSANAQTPVPSPSPAPTPAASAREVEIKDIKAVMEAQSKAWNNGDIPGFMAGYWRSPRLTFVSGDTVTKGWQTTRDRYLKNYDSKAKMGTLTFADLDVRIISRTYAMVVGSWSLAREKDNPKGKFTLIFRKFRDGWKIIHDHTS